MRYNVCKWHYEFCSAYWLFRQPVHIRIHAQMHRLQEEKYVVEILSAPFSPYVVLMRNELPR